MPAETHFQRLLPPVHICTFPIRRATLLLGILFLVSAVAHAGWTTFGLASDATAGRSVTTSGGWTNGDNASDNSTTTYASEPYPGNGYGATIQFNLGSAQYCSHFRLNTDIGIGQVDAVRVTVYDTDDSRWETVFDDTDAPQPQNGQWFLSEFLDHSGYGSGGRNIDKLTFEFHWVAGTSTFWLYEFQVWVGSTPVVVPTVTTQAASSVEETSAVIHGLCDDSGGEPCEYQFQWREQGSGDPWTATGWNFRSGIDTGTHVSELITGLTDLTTYEYYVQMRNSAGTTDGSTLTFTTGNPGTGWVSPTSGSDTGGGSGGTWQDLPFTYDDDFDTYAWAYHDIGDGQWSNWVELGHSDILIDALRFRGRDGALVDQVDLEYQLVGSAVWTSLLSSEPFTTDHDWVTEAVLPVVEIQAARIRFHAAAAGTGFNWEFDEFAFHRVLSLNISGYADTAGTISVDTDGDGTPEDSVTLGAPGTYTFNNLIVATGDRALVYYDGEAFTGAAVTVLEVLDPPTNITDLDLYANALTVYEHLDGTMTTADLIAALGATPDADVPYSFTGTDITMDSGTAFRIASGIEFDLEANTLTLTDDFVNDGTFTSDAAGGAAVVFAGGTGEISGSSTTTFPDLTITSGTLTGHAGTMILAGDFTNTGGTYVHNSGTIEILDTTTITEISDFGTLYLPVNTTLTLDTTDPTIDIENLTMENTGSAMIVPDGSTITVSGATNLEGGPCCCDRCIDGTCGYLCYATIKTPDCGDTFDMVFEGSFVGSRVHFMNVGDGTIEFQGFPTSLSRVNFTCGSGTDPWVRYNNDNDVTWDHLGFYQGTGDKDETIETAAGSTGNVTVDIYANNKGWIGGDATDDEQGGTVTWTNGTPVRQLTGSVVPAENGGIAVQWNTRGEDGVALFEIQRLGKNGWEIIGLLPARGAWLGDAKYDFLDPEAKQDEYHEYAINAVDIGGKSEQFALGGTRATTTVVESPLRQLQETRLTDDLPEADLTPVSGSIPTYITDLPRQWGTARKAEIQAGGLYEISGSDPVYCLGNQLSVLPGNLVFARALKSFYTDTNVLWQGNLTFSGTPATLPEPGIQGILNDGGFVGIFHYEIDASFSVNPYLPPGPNWYFPSSFDLVGGEYVSIPMAVTAPLAGGAGRLIVNLRADTTGNHNLTLGINGVPLGKVAWAETGHFQISVEFSNDDVSLVDGTNTIILQTEGSGSVKKLDYIEIRTAATPTLRDGSLVFQCETQLVDQLNIPGAQLAADATLDGQESLLTVDEENVQGLTAGAIVYVTNAAKTLQWQESTELSVPDVQGIDYLVLAPDDMLDAISPLVSYRETTGLTAASVAMSRVVDVFGCGIFDPGAVQGLSAYATPKYLLLGASTTYDYLNRENRTHPAGIPVGFVHPYEGLAPTDDIYTNDFTTAVGRFPARTLEELENMVAKTIAYRPGRRAVLLAGEDGSADRFTELQTMLTDIMPTALIPSVERSNEDVRNELIAAIQAGARLVTYQGHAGAGQLDSDALISTAHVPSIPLSSWLLSTCLTGSYLLDDWSIPVLSQRLLAEPDNGAALVLCSTRWGDMMEEHALVREVLTAAATTQPTWGDLVLLIKKELSSMETIKHYSLLGDPALETVDLTDVRQLALLEPLGGTVASTPDTVNIRLEISEDGWWKERINLYEQHDGEDWSAVGTVQLQPEQTVYDFAWTPPGDGLGYQILARQAPPEEGEPEQALLEVSSGVFDVDQTPPETPLLTEPSDGAYVYETVVRLRAESSDETTGVEAYQFEVNGQIYAWQSDPLLTLSGIDNGTYYWTARAKDRGGLFSNWAPTASFDFYLDGDNDADGILDTWEITYFGSIEFSDGTGDADGDGETDWEEFIAETHPFSFSAEIKPGWSIIALPCEPDVTAMETLNAVFTGPFWAWDGTQYTEVDAPVAFQGFWAFATDAAQLTIEGVLPDFNRVTLHAGWNLAGPGWPLVIPVSDTLEYIWDWNGIGYKVLVPDSEQQFQPLKGYWLRSPGGEILFGPQETGD